MTTQILGSILVGLIVSAALFLPHLVWQYRCYGRFDGLRMLWTTAGFIYATAIVAFTVFPLPEFTADYCAAHSTRPLIDPLRLPRELVDLVRSQGPRAVLSDGLVWEFGLNIVLFIPFGLIVRRVMEWPRAAVFTAALSTSMLIELTQLTGNWGLAPCSYRFADTTDLITNTAGAVIGIGLEALTPRFLSTKAHLLARRDRARPVTRGRRVLGMVLDAWFLILAGVVGGTLGSTLYTLTQGGHGDPLTADQYLALERALVTGAWITALSVVVVVPALVGTGASLGQRTVYLAPVPRNGSRARLVARALAVQGAMVTGLCAGIPSSLLVLPLGATTLLAVAVDPRGFSCLLAGCRLRDARQPASGEAPDPPPTARDRVSLTA